MSSSAASATSLSPQPRGRLRRYPARSLVALAAAAGCTALPGIAQAATAPKVPLPVSTTACNKISRSAVSSIVGFTVPAPTGETITTTIDAALKLSATATTCSYIVAGSLSNPFGSKTVNLSSEVFNKTVTLDTLKAAEEAEQEKIAKAQKIDNFKVTSSSYSGLGVTAIYFTVTASIHIPGLPTGVTLPKGMTLPKGLNFAYSGIATLNGRQSYDASVNNDTIAQSKLAALVSLAMKL